MYCINLAVYKTKERMSGLMSIKWTEKNQMGINNASFWLGERPLL